MKYPSLEWLTEFERSRGMRSPGYARSIEYFKRFETRSKHARLMPIGKTPQGRVLYCLIAASGREFTPAKAKASRKAVVLVQNGIHAGEIEGKDACMLLLRDILITKERSHLLDNVILLVIPVLNADGHERTSEFNRPNQNGPEEMGWRTNSRNLNLNRDFMKADAPETRAFLSLFQEWTPDFFIDNHATNGADYQYHVTYALEKNANIDARLGEWGQRSFLPDVLTSVEHEGFLTAPYIQFKEDTVESGIIDPPALPRFSTGYTAAQNRLGLLVETHSLKPFENRVRSTYAMNYAALEYINKHHKHLKRLNAAADSAASKLKELEISFTLSDNSTPFDFKALQAIYHNSSITGNDVPHYSRTPVNQIIPYFGEVQTTKKISLPKAYVIPLQWEDILAVLDLHGIAYSRMKKRQTLTVVQYGFGDYRFSPRPYEGRQGVNVTCFRTEKRVAFDAGTAVVRTDQRTNRVLVHLLEPESPDSFVSWGFFNAFFERKEYAEAYILEPIALKMLKDDPKLQQEFTARLKDEKFRNDPAARLDFFYTRSPYFDSAERKYPIYRVE